MVTTEMNRLSYEEPVATILPWTSYSMMTTRGSCDQCTTGSSASPPETVQAAWQNSPLFELARLLVRLNHVARFIVNANHNIV
jgi:hypothetical protein